MQLIRAIPPFSQFFHDRYNVISIADVLISDVNIICNIFVSIIMRRCSLPLENNRMHRLATDFEFEITKDINCMTRSCIEQYV